MICKAMAAKAKLTFYGIHRRQSISKTWPRQVYRQAPSLDFSGAIKRFEGDLQPGDLVAVRAAGVSIWRRRMSTNGRKSSPAL